MDDDDDDDDDLESLFKFVVETVEEDADDNKLDVDAPEVASLEADPPIDRGFSSPASLPVSRGC